ncbi:MAG TPA: translation initiation factor IF-2 [Candidatus Onthovivens sp.]|nr:translation initiation factor IF-2 [Candidatus Onthovivens sp.]
MKRANNSNKKFVRESNVPKKGTQKTTNLNKVQGGVFVYTKSLTVGELAKQLGVLPAEIIKKLFLEKKLVTINNYLDDQTIGELCIEYGFDFKKEEIVADEDFDKMNIEDKAEDLLERSPVVTVMGHVDHGKTTLIDAIRNSNVVDSEVGGISQEIGAYQKTINGKKITFIDTPGHEAFSAMRSRGAKVTDIVVLVVASDDGVMPQTIEAIDHAKAAGVPVIVAINKMDVPGANPDKVLTELLAHDIIAEEYNGDVIICKISAKKREGIKELLESIVLQSEMLELKSNPKRYASGTVLEAELDKGEGPKATLLVQNGTLLSSDFVVVGTTYGKVRRMTNEHNLILKTAGPSTPVSIIGLSDVPLAGESFMAFSSEKQAREIAQKRLEKKVEEERALTQGISTIDEVYNKMSENQKFTLTLLIKADSTGSAEAVKSSLEKLNSEKVNINVIRSAPGAITESDVLLASASHAIIYGFSVRPSAQVRKLAEEHGVSIILHRIIYALIEDVEDLLKGKVKKDEVEKVQGQAEVRNVFKVTKVGLIAGCMVTDGSIKANALCRVLRAGIIIYEGKLESLKRFKDDVKEARSGFECGIKIENFNDIHEGDIIETYEMVEVENGK